MPTFLSVSNVLRAPITAGEARSTHNVVTFDMKKDPPDDATLLKHLLGPRGHLRTPAVRRGKTLLVGFHDETYAASLS